MIEIGTYITARTESGKLARGTVVSRDRGADGNILYYGVRNPVTGRTAQVFPATWEITVPAV